MFGTRWRLFRMFGIPINVDPSWLVILALLTWTLATEVFQDLPERDLWIMGMATALVFFVCILLHEMGHALVARALGIPIRGITLFLFGGVAEMGDEPLSAGSEFLMAAAGPLVSLCLAILFWIASQAGAQAGWAKQVVMPLSYLGGINLTLLIFNLIPAFPLDGGRIFRSALWGILGNLRRATYWASLLGQAFSWVLMGLGIYLFIKGNLMGGIWMGLIGLFLNRAAQGSYQQVVVREALQGEPVSRFMNTQPIVVPPTLDLRQWVDDYVYRYHRKSFPVATDGLLEGFIHTQALSQFPRPEWEKHHVAEVMEHDLGSVSIPPTADALQALSKMQRTGLSRLLVTEGGKLVGIVSLKDLLRFLDNKLTLENLAD